MSSMLAVDRLRKQFATVLAVDDVSFSVRPGQIFGLIGPNGAGKSTTIRMIMKILEPDSGTITLGGAPITHAMQNRVGYLPEERGLYRKNKLANVIAYFASLKGLDAREAHARARAWIERFSLERYLHRNVEELSKGNQQKVQFIISVLHRPDLLVLDEVFSGLDPINQVIIRDALREQKNDNRAIIFSTHQMDLAEKLCDDLVLINKGRVVLEGPPADIKGRYGRNAVHIAYEGDGSFLAGLEGVRRADISENFAELELAPATTTNALLAACLPRIEVQSVARIEPSLQAIFIDTVGMPDEAAAEAAPRPQATAVRDKRVKRQFLSMLLAALFLCGATAMQASRGQFDGTIIALFAALLVFSIWKYVRVKRAVERELRDARDDGPAARKGGQQS
jgi:ABC-2 type transport system ATP-binding protein